MLAPSGSAWAEALASELAAAGPHAFAWRRSAAALLGLDGYLEGDEGFAGQPEVAVAYPRSPRRQARGDVARLTNVGPGDLVVCRAMPATCAGRTLFDIAALGDADLAERAVEASLRQGLIDDRTLRELAKFRAFRGAPLLREVLDRRPAGTKPTESDAETRMVQLCRRGPLPDPVRQLPQLLGQRFRLDLAWPEWRVAIEVDGRKSHGEERFVADRRRQNRIVLAGWLLLRFTWVDIVLEPDATLAVCRQALRQCGWSGPR